MNTHDLIFRVGEVLGWALIDDEVVFESNYTYFLDFIIH